MNPKGSVSRDDALILLIIMIWGINFPILKQALSAMHPFALNVFRFIASMLALCGTMVVKKRSVKIFPWKTLKPHFKRVLAMGMLGYFFYQLVFIMGIERTTAGNSALILSSSPIWTALVGILFKFERLRPQAWLGLGVSLVGTFLVVLFGHNNVHLSGEFMTGNFLMLASAIMWGSYTAFSRPMTNRVDAITLTTVGLMCAFPLNVLIALPYFEQIDWSIVTFPVWTAILYSGGLSTGIAVALWVVLVQRSGATHTAVFANLVPLIAILGSFVLLGEVITIPQFIGGSAIIGGLLIMRNDRRKI